MIGLLLLLVAVSATALPNSRIHNGDDVSHLSHPHQVALLRYGHQHCGGIILGQYWVLTAAHCVLEGTEVYTVVVNEHSHSNFEGPEQHYRVVFIYKHEYYVNSDNFPNDIALMWLDSRDGPELQNGVTLAGPLDGYFTDEICTITGWGFTENDTSSDVLQEAEMRVMSNDECYYAWWGDAILTEHICVHAEDMTACSGDSGGPLMCGDKLAGVMSWMVGGCIYNDEYWPSVYTRVSEYSDWILLNTGL